MPRAKQPFSIKRQRGPKIPVPLIAAVQAWLLVRGLYSGPHQTGRSIPVRYKARSHADGQEQLIGAQVLHEITNLFKL